MSFKTSGPLVLLMIVCLIEFKLWKAKNENATGDSTGGEQIF